MVVIHMFYIMYRDLRAGAADQVRLWIACSKFTKICWSRQMLLRLVRMLFFAPSELHLYSRNLTPLI